MDRDLFLAILSMDAYNRGYNPGVKLQAGATHIGLAEVLPDSEQRPDVIGGQSAGFYGIAYDVGNVEGFNSTEKVISYRGTDKLLSGPFDTIGSDILNGYGVGALTGCGEQAALAMEGALA